MKTRRFFAGKLAQRGVGNSVEFAAFVANAKDIALWSGIRRVGKHEKGIQRILKETRVKSIQRFLSKDVTNTIPTCIVVAFLPGAVQFTSHQTELSNCIGEFDTKNGVAERMEWGIIEFEFDPQAEEHKRPALLVDGQHRLKGMERLDEEIPILVVALLDASPEEQAFQFVVINNKSAKVPTDNVKAIISDITENDLQDRLSKAGVNYGDIPAVLREINDRTDSPFHNLLDWPLNPNEKNRKIKLTTIEACLRYLRKAIPAVNEFGDEETEKEVFISIWKGISDRYSALWNTNDKFMAKVSINALNEVIVDRLEYAWVDGTVNIYEPSNVESYTVQVVDKIPDSFWEEDWTIRLQDNSVIRNQIKEDLRKIAHNVRNTKKAWYENLKLVSP